MEQKRGKTLVGWLPAGFALAAALTLAGAAPLPEQRGFAALGLALGSLGLLLALRLWSALEASSAWRRVALVGLVARAIVWIGPEPGTSDDIHRYVWEGGLVARGVSPYAHAPADPERAGERALWGETFERMNNTDVSAAYPPLTQAACALVVGATGGPERPARARRGLRLVFGLCDWLVLLPLLRLCRRRGLHPACLAVWSLLPGVWLEFAGAGHFDSLGILALTAAVAWLDAGRGAARGTTNCAQAPSRARLVAGSLALVAGGLVKLLPLALLPVLLRGRALVAGGCLCALGVAGGYALIGLLDGGYAGLTAGLGEYGLRWESFNLTHRFVAPAFDAWSERDSSWLDARLLSRAFVLLLFGAAIVAARRARDRVLATGGVLFAFALLTPTLHPWYAMWLVPFCALDAGRERSARVLRAGFALALLVPLCYWPLTRWRAEAVWQEPGWLWPVIALPVLAALVRDVRSVCAR